MKRNHYPGGKSGAGVWQTLINEIPPHDVYISATVGNDPVLRFKRPAVRNIAVDLDAAALDLWRDRDDVERVHADGLAFVERFVADNGDAAGETVVLFDPPYPAEVRKSRRPIYLAEQLEFAWHRRLLDAVVRLPCRVLICCYPDPRYLRALAGWRIVEYFSTDRSGERRAENLFCNFPRPDRLHDSRFIGRDRRDRERIRKNWRTLTNRFARMPAVERAAAVERIVERLDDDERRFLLKLLATPKPAADY